VGGGNNKILIKERGLQCIYIFTLSFESRDQQKNYIAIVTTLSVLINTLQNPGKAIWH